MSTTKQCRTCGTDVPAGAPFGHCPKCLIDLGFGPLPDDLPAAGGSAGDQRFGDYELVEQLGRGGMGVVYKARQVRLNRLVALKMINSGEFASPTLIQRFHREAEAAANLHHPNIVPIYEIGELRGQHFYSMQLVEGTGLDKHISRSGFKSDSASADARTGARDRQKQIAQILATVARAVDYAHRHGVLHRDLKPGNILLDAIGEPHLTDFGVAKVMGHDASNLTASGAIMGTPSYMAPEQAVGDSKHITVAADIYSLGAVLYSMLTGSPPFRASTPLETLKQVIEQEPKHPSTIREGLDFDLATIAMKCLEKEPQRRYSSALALAEDLERWLIDEPILARPIPVAARLWRWCRRNRAATAVLVLLVSGLAISLFLLRQVSIERDQRERNARILNKSITQGVERFAAPQTYIPLASEELAALVGARPNERMPNIRFTVGAMISKNPMETTVSFARFFPVLEARVSERLGEDVRFDLKIYRDRAAARSDFLAGTVDLIELDRMILNDALSDNGGVVPLLRQSGAGYPTVVITRPDTGITNLAGIRGHTLAMWDPNSIFSLSARAWLFEKGFCGTQLQWIYLINTEPFAAQRSGVYVEESPPGDYDRTGSVVPALRDGHFDVVVCPISQLSVLQEGKDWVRLGEFLTPHSVWLGRPGLAPKFANAFRRSMCDLKPEEYALIANSVGTRRGETTGFVAINAGDVAAFRETLRRASGFQTCGPQPVPQAAKKLAVHSSP